MTSNLIGNGCATALAATLLEARGSKRRPIFERWRIRYASYWFEKLDKMQPPAVSPDQPLPHPKNLAFLMGFWRSGTTLLHNWVASAAHARTPLSWQCFNPATHMLRDKGTNAQSLRRPMDDGETGPLAPQEDEFALLLLGEPSLYRIFLDAANCEHICEQTIACSDTSLPRWKRFLLQLQGEQRETLLLKSPNHIFRIPMLDREFPDAPMVWVGRDFDQVLRSNWEMWASVSELNSPIPLEPRQIDALLWKLSGVYLDTLRGQLNVSRRKHLWIDFDHLCTNPKAQAERVASFMDLPARSGQVFEDGLLEVRTRNQAAPDLRFSDFHWRDRISEIDSCHREAAQKWSGAES